MERNLTLVALFAALIAALGLIPQMTLAFGVPITAQSLGVMLCGTVLGARLGGLAALLFVVLVALGLPLLAGGRGGLGMFVTGSSGYLLGFVLGAAATGWLMERLRALHAGLAAGIAALFGGVLVLHLCGIAGLMIVLGLTFGEALALDLAFLPGDAVKAVLAGVITAGLARARPASVVSRR